LNTTLAIHSVGDVCTYVYVIGFFDCFSSEFILKGQILKPLVVFFERGVVPPIVRFLHIGRNKEKKWGGGGAEKNRTYSHFSSWTRTFDSSLRAIQDFRLIT
jgi:hypothetical protein